MDNKIKDRIAEYLKSGDKKKLIMIAGIIGIVLIMASELIPGSVSSNKAKTEEFNYYTYIESLEEKTEDIISSISGVGRCEVMITISDTDENVFAKNIDENTDDSSYSRKSEYVFYEADSGDAPVLIKQRLPKVQGVLIVCEGGDDVVVREAVIGSVTSLFNISSGKVSVSKISNK